MNIFEQFNGNPPVTSLALSNFATKSGFTLPQGYIRFIQCFNGGEGFIGPNSYVMIWRLEELLEFNTAYQVSDYAPGLFLFGSDGGGEAFAFDMRSDFKPILSVPFVGMDLSLVRVIAPDFDKFLEALHKS
jgi:hypothetical protein